MENPLSKLVTLLLHERQRNFIIGAIGQFPDAEDVSVLCRESLTHAVGGKLALHFKARSEIETVIEGLLPEGLEKKSVRSSRKHPPVSFVRADKSITFNVTERIFNAMSLAANRKSLTQDKFCQEVIYDAIEQGGLVRRYNKAAVEKIIDEILEQYGYNSLFSTEEKTSGLKKPNRDTAREILITDNEYQALQIAVDQEFFGARNFSALCRESLAYGIRDKELVKKFSVGHLIPKNVNQPTQRISFSVAQQEINQADKIADLTGTDHADFYLVLISSVLLQAEAQLKRGNQDIRAIAYNVLKERGILPSEPA